MEALPETAEGGTARDDGTSHTPSQSSRSGGLREALAAEQAQAAGEATEVWQLLLRAT